MTIVRRQLLSGAAASLAAPALIRYAHAKSPEVTLKMHHFLPAVANGHAKFLAPWAKKVEADSEGRIKIDIFPSMQLGGAPPQLYDQARDGVADLVWTLPGNTPGRFPAIEAFELPFVSARRAIVNSKAVQEYGELHLAKEFGEVHPICFWAHDHGLIHANRQVKTLEDLDGLKLRFPTRLAGQALTALGASAIGMPIPQVPESLAQQVIDGAVVPWEVVPAIKLHELVKYHTDIPGSPTLYTTTFILAMNKPKYESLASDLKAILDKNSGQFAAAMAGTAWDECAPPARALTEKRGNIITVLSDEETARWRKTTQPVIDRWVADSKGRGIEGGKLLESARALLAKYETA